jgi:two-component sensor histidine kinase
VEPGTQLLFGYTTEEAVGKPVTILIPTEPTILERIRLGQSIDHYETIRQRKEREPRQYSLTVKNLFRLAISLLTLSGRYATTVPQLIDSTRDRLSALARAHALTLSQGPGASHSPRPATLHSLIEAITAPHLDAGDGRRFSILGCDMEISGSTIFSLALLLHEFATNSVKYGALSSTTGQIQVKCADRAGNVVITWSEQGGPEVAPPISNAGFGDLLVRATVGQLSGDISRKWKPEGLVIRLSVPRERLTDLIYWREKGGPRAALSSKVGRNARRGRSRRAFVAAIRHRRRAEGLDFRSPAPYFAPVVCTLISCINQVNLRRRIRKSKQKAGSRRSLGRSTILRRAVAADQVPCSANKVVEHG